MATFLTFQNNFFASKNILFWSSSLKHVTKFFYRIIILTSLDFSMNRTAFRTICFLSRTKKLNFEAPFCFLEVQKIPHRIELKKAKRNQKYFRLNGLLSRFSQNLCKICRIKRISFSKVFNLDLVHNHIFYIISIFSKNSTYISSSLINKTVVDLIFQFFPNLHWFTEDRFL